MTIEPAVQEPHRPATEPADMPLAPGSFEAQRHFYERVLNAQIHPLVRYFFQLGNERIAERYCHLHPEAEPSAVRAVLAAEPRWFRWGGADLFVTSTERGLRRIVVVETNSCPSGQKSMPQIREGDEQAGYRLLVEHTFSGVLRGRGLPRGELAVLYDKNPMEASGYAAAIADYTNEHVHLVELHHEQAGRTARFREDGVLEVCAAGEWVPIRAAQRYVTQRPWTRIPPIARTAILNPVVTCLAGGRNKLVAAKAYDVLNGRLTTAGLRIKTPETIWDVSRGEVPLWFDRMGGATVVKNPYSNAGQGVYTLTSREELEAFMDVEQPYERFVVQGLVGNSGWSSRTQSGRLFHVGTVPDKHGRIFAADLRCMVVAGASGFRPAALYARRARTPLADQPAVGGRSWDVLGTNLSYRKDDGSWGTETDRLLLMDSRDFNRLGLGLDDLIETYLQTVLAMTAIDEMASRLVTKSRKFRRRLFRELNPDDALLAEITTT